MKPFQFNLLPGEIRNKLYRYMLIYPDIDNRCSVLEQSAIDPCDLGSMPHKVNKNIKPLGQGPVILSILQKLQQRANDMFWDQRIYLWLSETKVKSIIFRNHGPQFLSPTSKNKHPALEKVRHWNIVVDFRDRESRQSQSDMPNCLELFCRAICRNQPPPKLLDVAIVGDRNIQVNFEYLLRPLEKLRNIEEVVIRDATTADYQDVTKIEEDLSRQRRIYKAASWIEGNETNEYHVARVTQLMKSSSPIGETAFEIEQQLMNYIGALSGKLETCHPRFKMDVDYPFRWSLSKYPFPRFPSAGNAWPHESQPSRSLHVALGYYSSPLYRFRRTPED
jgi:hypothetical protein